MSTRGPGARLPHPDERRRQLEERFPQWNPMTLSKSLDAAVELYGDQPLVITDERSYSYCEIQRWSRDLAAGMVACGLRPGDHVALVMANYPEFVALKYAIARVGATTIPVNFLFRRSELGYVLEQSNARMLITMNELRGLDYLEELDAIMPGWETAAGGGDLPHLRHVFVLSTNGATRPGTRSVADLAALGTDADRNVVAACEADADPDSLSDILYTSGTTGRPKGVTMTHDMVLRTAYGSAYWCGFEPGRRLLYALPMYHVFGYVECLIAATFVGGGVIPHVLFDPVAMLEAVGRHRANEIVAVPLMTRKLLEAAQQRDYDLASLHTVFSSGGAAPPALWADVRSILGVEEMLTAYGMTETTASTACTRPEDPDERLSTTNGKLKYAGVAGLAEFGGLLAQYKVRDPETGEDLKPGQRGEFLAKGLNITPGYYNKSEETAAAFTEDRWLRTGDIGVLDEDGYLRLTGRIKESYRCGGEMVMPREVELVINEHPLVADAHIVGLPDERMGEIGCACVILQAAVEPPDAQEIIDLCARQLAKFKVPRHVVYMTADELPLTATGRVQKFKLTEMARQRIAQPNTAATTATAKA
jgi:fatty-acyl-CoA synthase